MPDLGRSSLIVNKKAVALLPVNLLANSEFTLDIGNWFSTNNMRANTACSQLVDLS